MQETLTLFCRFSTSLIYFALSLNSGSLSGDVFVNTFLLGLVEIPANLINMFVLHKGILGKCTSYRNSDTGSLLLTSWSNLDLSGLKSIVLQNVQETDLRVFMFYQVEEQ